MLSNMIPKKISCFLPLISYWFYYLRFKKNIYFLKLLLTAFLVTEGIDIFIGLLRLVWRPLAGVAGRLWRPQGGRPLDDPGVQRLYRLVAPVAAFAVFLRTCGIRKSRM